MLTPIQRKVIPLILKGKNVIATSRTGSGKTAAFLLPIIQKINDLKTINPCKSKVNMIGHTIKAIIISPTRELALQTFKFSKEFSKNLKVKCDLILGGDSLETQFALFHNKDPHEQPDILIATPGRLMHIFEEMNIGRLSNMKFLVLDEADRLLELGFAPQIVVLFQNHLPILNMNNSGLFSQSSNSHSMQILLFSATFSSQMAQTFTNSGCVNAADDQASSIFPDYDETNPSSFVFAKCDTDYKISPQLKMEFIACKGNNHFTLSTSASPDKLNCLFYLLNKHSNSNSVGNDSKKLRKSPRTKVIGGNSERVEDSCGIMAFPDRSNESARAKTISTYAKLQDKNAQPCIITNTTQTKDVSTDTSSQSQTTKTDVLKEEKATKKWKTLVFLPTKYHVDYIKELIQVQLGIDCAYVYSSLDPSARKLNLNNFREGLTEILLVTDIAARGLDIPLLDCVINFTFPSTPKLFLHRIGRVARAGNVGTAYSLVSHHEVPQVLDFLNYIGQDLVYLRAGIFPDTITQERLEEGISRPFHLFGNVPEDLAELSGINTTSTQSVFTSCTDKSLVSNVKLSDKEYDLNYLATVCDRAMGKFEKSQSKPSHGSIRRAKSEFIDFGGAGMLKPHALFEREGGVCFNNNNPSSSSSLLRKQHCLDDKLRFLERLKHFKTREISQQKVLHFPSNNKFIGKDFHTESSASVQSSDFLSSANPSSLDKVTTETDGIAINSKLPRISRKSNVMIPLSFNTLGGRGVPEQTRKNGFRMPKFADSRLFIPYVAPDNEGVSDVLLETPESMILDLKTDDSKQLKSTSFGTQTAHSNHNNNHQRNKLIWDQKRKRFVNMNDQMNGTKKQRTIRNESGVRVKIQGNLGRGGGGGFGKGAANKHTELYQKWLEKTSGGQILPAVATSKLSHDSSSKQPRGAGNRIVTHENQDFDDNDNENNDEEKQLRNLENSKKDWRFKRNGPGSNINNHNNPKGRASTRDQSLPNLKPQKRFPSNKPNSNPSKRRNLGLKHPEQAFKIRYAKEQKQAFQTYRRNLNATKRESKNKRKKNRR